MNNSKIQADKKSRVKVLLISADVETGLGVLIEKEPGKISMESYVPFELMKDEFNIQMSDTTNIVKETAKFYDYFNNTQEKKND